jgi:Ser/Thr protein kinase RdoA (MazF antagonist)
MNTDFELLAKSLWHKFSGEEIEQLKLLPFGFKNKTYYIRTKKGIEFALKIYSINFLTKSQIEERAKIVESVRSRGLPTLEFVAGFDGKFTQAYILNADTYLSTLSKYSYIQFSETQVNKAMVNNTATELRRLHDEFNKIEYSRDFKKLNFKILDMFLSDSTESLILDYFERNHNHLNKYDEFLSFYINEGVKLSKYFDNRSIMSEKIQLNHGDFNSNNFHIENCKIIKIFDFDEMVLGPRTWDISLSIYSLDYSEEFYTDELIEIFISSYYNKTEITKSVVSDVTELLKYRAFNRMARYFINFQFKDNPGGHFTKFRRHLEKYNQIDKDEICRILAINS